MADNRDEHVYGFNKEDAGELVQMIGKAPPPSRPTRRSLGNSGQDNSFIVLTPTGGIAKRVGTAITQVDCQVYSAVGGTLTSLGFSLPVGNLSSNGDVAENKYCIAVRVGGILVIDWEDCE